MSDNKIFIAYGAGMIDYLHAMICTVDNTTITVETDVELSVERYVGYRISATKISENKILIAHSYNDNYYLNAMICTIDNTTITADTDIELSAVVRSGYGISTILVLSNKVFVTHNSDSSNNYLYAMLCDTIEEKGVKRLENVTDEIFGIAKTRGTDGQAIEVIVPDI